MSAAHLNQRDLARRLKLSPRTLEGWRWRGTGPRFVKAGGRVIYRLEDIQAFEAEQLRQRTPRRRKSRTSTIGAKDGSDA
jgi:predicted site-specific integrase-resolvase